MMEAGRVTYYLDLWRSYMQQDSHKLGYKSKSTGFNTGGIHSFEDMADEVDSDAARVVDQVIDDLPTMQKNALYVVYLSQKATMDTRVLEYYFDSALMMLQRKLKEKNLY
jgi:hypothetical protein